MLGNIKTAPVGGFLQQAHAKKSDIRCRNDTLSEQFITFSAIEPLRKLR